MLKNPQNLKEKNNEHQRLEAALQLNKPLATAYYLKEDMRQIWVQKDKSTAIAFLDDWILRARSSGIKMLNSFANPLNRHRKVFWLITISLSQQVHWKGPTTKSKHCRNKHMDFWI